MEPKHLRRLQKQLYVQVPLIGGWLRRRAMNALAEDGSPDAVRVLAEAVARTEDVDFAFDISTEVLWKLTDQPAIDAVCAAWTQTRHAGLGVLLQRRDWIASAPARVRVLSALWIGRLDEIGDGEAVASPLVEACEDVDSTIADRARPFVGSLTDQRSRKAVAALLCTRWADTRSPVLEGVMLAGNYVAEEPLKARILSALKTGQASLLQDLGVEVVEFLIEACDDSDEVIAGEAAQALGSLRSVGAREEVCRLVIEQGHPIAQNAAVAGGYLPRDSYSRALFLFVTEQWNRYEDVDFDGRLLVTIYASASADLRQRIITKLRAAGRTHYLRILAGGDYRSRVTVMTSSETEFLVQMLAEKEEWTKLWDLTFDVPLHWSLRILRILGGSGWQPQAGDDRVLYRELVPLAATDLKFSQKELSQQLPPAVRLARMRVAVGRINDVAFSPDGPVIGLGTSQRRVIAWHFARGEPEWVSSTLKHSIGRVAFTHTANLVCAERTSNTRTPCSVYGRRNAKMVKLRQHTGSVTSVKAIGGSRIMTTGRDQKVAILDQETARTLNERHFPFWAREACIAPNGELAALLHTGATLVSLPELEEIRSTSDWDWWSPFRHAAFSPDGQELIAGRYAREVLVVSKAGESLSVGPSFARRQVLVNHTGTIQAVVMLDRRSVLITAASEGDILFTAWDNRSVIGGVHTSGPRLTSLHTSPDESFMAVSDSDGFVSLWDLRTLDVPLLFTAPLAKTVPDHLAAVQAAKQIADLSDKLRRALELLERVMQYRFRYDIEIGEVPTIKVGEFDIEIG